MSDGDDGPAEAGDAIATDQVRALDEAPSLEAAARGTGLALRRRRGLVGDVRYFAGAFLGLSRARRERDRLEARLADARARRGRAVVALAAQAVSTTSLVHPALDDARATLAILEHDHGAHDRERSETAGAAFALRREHEEQSRARLTEITGHEEALAALATREAPLERDVARVRGRLDELAAELDRLDGARARLEARLARASADERAALEAELATARANREQVARDRPALATELDGLLPSLARLEAARAEAQARLDAARAVFRADAEKLETELRALASRSEALDRADADARRAREACLAALGEKLVLERPAILRRPLAELDDLDAAIATDQRRLLDLDELIDGVDRRAMARGGALVLAGVLALLALIWLLGRA